MARSENVFVFTQVTPKGLQLSYELNSNVGEVAAYTRRFMFLLSRIEESNGIPYRKFHPDKSSTWEII
jgi:hypothetical protein